MGLRGLVGFLLVVAIALAFGAFMFYNFTEYSTGKEVFSGLIEERIVQETSEDDLVKAEQSVKKQCGTKEFAELKLSRNILEIECSQLAEKPFLAAVSGAIYDQQIYYRKYDCKSFGCLLEQETFPAVIAEQSHAGYRTYYLALFAISIVLAVLLFLISSGWHRKAISFGYVFLISGLGAVPFLFTRQVFGVPLLFMQKAVYLQLAMLIIGIILLVAAATIPKKEEVEKNA